MSIDGLRSGGTPAPNGGAGSVKGGRGAGAREAAATPSRAAGTGADRVEVSEASRAAASSGPGATGSLSPARLAEVGQRLASGFYDSPEVRDAIARRIASDL
ncbi:MAG: hypothetical protein NW201_08345 [Gemmatimonadales bacterium]|nr:hypothetical protein [Gemmatimonadales bacterium]